MLVPTTRQDQNKMAEQQCEVEVGIDTAAYVIDKPCVLTSITLLVAPDPWGAVLREGYFSEGSVHLVVDRDYGGDYPMERCMDKVCKFSYGQETVALFRGCLPCGIRAELRFSSRDSAHRLRVRYTLL
jgi:hypothetical protein